LHQSPSFRRNIKLLDDSWDKSYDQFDSSIKSLLHHNEWKRYEPRKISIQREKDKAECLGYVLVDQGRPYRKHKFDQYDSLDFPMTSKYKKDKFLGSNYEKPPLPPPTGTGKFNKFEKESNVQLLERVRTVCTTYMTSPDK
jgi:hypothetical protein